MPHLTRPLPDLIGIYVEAFLRVACAVNAVSAKPLILRRRPLEASREKAGGRYTVGFSLRLPAQFPVPSRLSADCNGVVNERLMAG